MRILYLLCFCMHVVLGHSQKHLPIQSLSEAITVDGDLNEPTWTNAHWNVSNFTQLKPFPGVSSSKKTAVSLFYDNEALYIGVKCFDEYDSISRVLTLRDDYPSTADVFGIFLDTYNDHQNGFFFGITSRGVQLDAKIFNNDYNDQLNLVWFSRVKIQEDHWSIEIKIPFSALRFPKKEVQNWNINFGRQISRFREEAAWNPVNPDLENYLIESGKLTGLKNIVPPIRLAIMPYVSFYANQLELGTQKAWTSLINGGLDVKYGLNESFTLDMTLIPDFGQVVFDQQVLNLSPFEIEFNENRQFFTEGFELFNKSELFYSRRIGVQPAKEVSTSQLNENEYLINSSTAPQLLNASKISGRMSNGLGIGFFNALTKEEVGQAFDPVLNAERTVVTSPLTNYNVLVLDQNLKNNSSITLTNTSVLREGTFYDANVTGINTNFNTKKNTFNFNSRAVLSSIFDEKTSLGHSLSLGAGKQRGAFVYGLEYTEESDTYDPNDLGFNFNNNKRNIEIESGYRNFNPDNKYLSKYLFSANLFQNYLYNPSRFVGTYGRISGVFVSNKFNAAGFSLESALTKRYDFFEPRTEGYFFLRPQSLGSRIWISSNYQRPFAIDLSTNYTLFNRENWRELTYTINPRLRLNSNFSFIYEWTQNNTYNEQGYAVAFANPINSPAGIVFGSRKRTDVIQMLGADYFMTNRISCNLRLRHYRSKVIYDGFYVLNENGLLEGLSGYTGLDADGNSAYNINYNAFTIDMNIKWVYYPGSELNIVWKNSIFSNDLLVNDFYWNNLYNTLQRGPLNSLSIKLIYWLDAGRLISKKKIS